MGVANPPCPPFAKGGELAGCEEEILQDTEVPPFLKGGLRGISVPLQQMQGNTKSPNTSGHPLGLPITPRPTRSAAENPLTAGPFLTNIAAWGIRESG